MSVVEKSIGELLVDNGQISADELRLAEREAKSTGEPLSIILSRLGLAYEHHFKNALELKYGVTYVSLARTEIQPEILKIVPEAKIREHMMVPVNEKGSRITVVMVNPEHSTGLAALKQYFGDRQFTPVVCTEDDFMLFMSNLYQENLDAKPTDKGNNGAKDENSSKKEAAPAAEAKAEEKPTLSPLAAFLAKGKAEQEAAAQAEAEAAAKAEAEAAAKGKAESEAAAKAEAEAAAKAKADAEAALKAETEAREKAEKEKAESEKAAADKAAADKEAAQKAEAEKAEAEKAEAAKVEAQKAEAEAKAKAESASLGKTEPEIVVKADLDSAYKSELDNMFRTEPEIPTNDETGKFDLNMLQKHIEETRNKAGKKPADNTSKSAGSEPAAKTEDKEPKEKQAEEKKEVEAPETKVEPAREDNKDSEAKKSEPEAEKKAAPVDEKKPESEDEKKAESVEEKKEEPKAEAEPQKKTEDKGSDTETKAETKAETKSETKSESKSETKKERPDARDVARELAKELAEEPGKAGLKDDEATGEFDALVSPTVEKKPPAQESKPEPKEEKKPEPEADSAAATKEETKQVLQDKTTEVKLEQASEEFKAITPKSTGEAGLGECEPVASESIARTSTEQKQPDALEKESDDAAVIMLCNQILANGIAKGASTIHVEAMDKQVLVHYRIQGQLMIVRKLPKMLMPALTQRFRKMGRVDQQDRRLPQDGRVKVRMSGKDFNLRLTVVPHTAGGEHILVWIE